MSPRNHDLHNELGAGTLPPAMEAWLLSRGAVFARTVETPAGTIVEFSCRPILDAMSDAVRDARQRLAEQRVRSAGFTAPISVLDLE